MLYEILQNITSNKISYFPQLRTRINRPFQLRYLLPSDKKNLSEFFKNLSKKTIQLRYMTSMPKISDEWLEQEINRLYRTNPASEIVIVAMTWKNGQEEIAGLAELRQQPQNPAVGEVAFIVRDAYQGEGIGRALLNELQNDLYKRGYSEWEAWTLVENRVARQLLRHLEGCENIEYYGEEIFLAGHLPQDRAA